MILGCTPEGLCWRTGELRDIMRANIMTGHTNPEKILNVQDPKVILLLQPLLLNKNDNL